ncbi:hypothetical protein Btru_022774 [Bulinus truncatus]|nr:hypothetical protein Btru_022774 [Bulinus truncatus]
MRNITLLLILSTVVTSSTTATPLDREGLSLFSPITPPSQSSDVYVDDESYQTESEDWSELDISLHDNTEYFEEENEPLQNNSTSAIQKESLDSECPVYTEFKNIKVMDCKSMNWKRVPQHPPQENDSFTFLSKLKYLNLKSNLLWLRRGTYPPGVFQPLKNLITLIINRNHFSKNQVVGQDYPDDALQDLTNLKNLHMDGLDSKTFGPGFAKMKSLRNLTLAGYAEGYCRLENILQDTFTNLKQLTFLNISDCYINGKSLTNSSLAPLVNLITLDLTYNVNIGIDKLITVFSGLQAPNLTHLYVSSIVTRFSRSIAIDRKLVVSLPASLTHLEAKENCFETIDMDVFSALPVGLKYINLGNNRLLFGRYLEKLHYLWNLQHLVMSRDNYLYNLPKQYPFKSDKASDIDSYDSRDTRESSMKSNYSFILTLPPNMTKLEMNTAGLVYFLSELKINENNRLEQLSISKNYFPVAKGPITGLKKLRYLDLTHCSLQSITQSFFQYFPSLKTLKLGYNDLKTLLSQKAIFRNLTQLTYLDLSNNRLANLSEDVFDGLDNLEKLHLESNRLTNFTMTISHMLKLKVININDSQLPTLPVAVRDHITYLRVNLKTDLYVDMSINPIHCDCDNLDFLEWMVHSPAFDRRFRLYQCIYLDTSIKYITDSYEETIRNLRRECAHNEPVFLVVLAATFLLVSLVAAGIAYRFRWKIRYLYYAAYLKVKQGRDSNDQVSFKYDVFLSYSHLDEPFVLSVIMPELESRGLLMHVHGRDFRVGDYIASNIAAAVMDSRKTLVILTRNLLSSKWCNYELQMANNEAIDTGRQVLVFLVKESIPSEELGRDLLNHIRNNTYNPYPTDELARDTNYMVTFWDKLACDLKQ